MDTCGYYIDLLTDMEDQGVFLKDLVARIGGKQKLVDWSEWLLEENVIQSMHPFMGMDLDDIFEGQLVVWDGWIRYDKERDLMLYEGNTEPSGVGENASRIVHDYDCIMVVLGPEGWKLKEARDE